MNTEHTNTFPSSQKNTISGGWMLNLIEEKITLVDEAYRILGINKRNFNKTIDSIFNFIHPDDIETIKTLATDIRQTTTPNTYEIEHRIIRPDGEERVIKETFKTNFNQNGELHMVNGTATDITERRLAEKAIQESEERYKSIFECSLAMLVTVNNDRKITAFNPEALNTFGYSREEILNQDVSLLYENPEDAATVQRDLLKNGKFIGQVINKKKNGETFIAQLSAAILYDSDGNQIGTVGSSLKIKD